jgi:hypothetical protein
MAGLNNFLSDTQQTSTTMPAWYDQAQQNIMSQGNTALGAAPTFANTTAQGAVNTLQGTNNPFTQAQGSLNQIATGAANPWIVDSTTGAVSPNTNTAMGGLFAAQQNQLNRLMPEYTAPSQAGAIGSGNFGSLRGQTAVQKAKGDAFSKLNAAQLQAALTNQQTGVSAGTALGNVGSQGINAGMNVGTAQMNAPYTNVSNYANLLGSMQVPTTTKSQVQYSPLGQITAIGNAATGATSGLNSLLKNVGVPGGLSSIFKGINFGSGTAGIKYGTDAATQEAATGGATPLDEEGNPMPGWTQSTDGSYSYNPANIPDTSGNSGGGGDTGTYEDLVNQESGNTNYTDSQLNDYQNYYPTYED